MTSPRTSDASGGGLSAAAAAAAAGSTQQQQQQQPHWTEVALAQAGLLLLFDCDFDRAFAAFDRCAPGAFQPAQLLELFPQHTARWAGALPRRAYWGLHGHGPLPSLQQLVEDWVELREATQPRGSSGQQHQHQHPRQHQTEAELAHRQQLVDQLVTAGTAAAAGYLHRARSRPGVALPAAVDTLLLHLLADVGDAAALEALVTRPNAVDRSNALAALKAAGRWHAAALLTSCGGDPEAALVIWQGLSRGALVESPAASGAVAAAGGGADAAVSVAVATAADELSDSGIVSAELVLRFLPWLLEVSTAGGRQVLGARGDLPSDQVLALMQGVCGLVVFGWSSVTASFVLFFLEPASAQQTFNSPSLPFAITPRPHRRPALAVPAACCAHARHTRPCTAYGPGLDAGDSGYGSPG